MEPKFYYRPPKSSIWGHLLRRMSAERARSLFGQFLEVAAAEYRFVSAMLMLHGVSDDAAKRFGRVVGCASPPGSFHMLSQEQCERCIDEVIRFETSDTREPLLLTQTFEITHWNIDGAKMPTNSTVTMYYGNLPCLSTFLLFDSVEQYHKIKQIVEDLKLCKFNDKHLKTLRTKPRSDEKRPGRI